MTRFPVVAGSFALSLMLCCGGREGLVEVSLRGSTGEAAGTGGADAQGGAAGNAMPQGGAGSPPNQGGAGTGAEPGGAAGGTIACTGGDLTLCSGPCGDTCSAIPEANCQKIYDIQGTSRIGFCEYFGGPMKGFFCYECPEGQVCSSSYVNPDPSHPLLFCVPQEVCQAALELGQSGCYFSDKSTFSLDPIPDPTSCPSLPGAKVCGGSCGDCAKGEFCTGRSPLHPTGLCVPNSLDIRCGSAVWECKSGLCFVHSSTPETTVFAQQNGVCLPDEACLAAATELPGGGACVDAKGKVLAGAFLAGP